jgi:hypothetical protein
MARVTRFALRAVLASAVVTLAPLAARAQTGPWTAVGSAGTVDETDNALAVFNQGIASIAPAAAVGASLDIRYNVVAVDGVFGGDGLAMNARFRDAGVAERVILRLKSYSFATGLTQTLLTLDSNTFPAAAGFQTRSVGACGLGLDFMRNAYFVEAQLIKAGAAGVPQLGAVQVGLTFC